MSLGVEMWVGKAVRVASSIPGMPVPSVMVSSGDLFGGFAKVDLKNLYELFLFKF